MSSLVNAVLESAREKAANDSNFYKNMVYYFELRLPASAAAPLPGTYYFPFAINPDSYTMEEPFAVEQTLTQGAGVYIEENGIITRTIRIRGNTGFAPRIIPGGNQPSQLLALSSVQNKSFSRSLSPWQAVAISGQLHFQYLQDAVFRTYADFVRDPATAQDTVLIFHNNKDSEHWVVIPRKFTLERNAQKPMQYMYDIDLLVVDKAESASVNLSTGDTSLLQDIKNAISTVNSAINMVKGAINDITNLVGEIKGLVNTIGTVISNVGSIVTAASNFVSGVTALIQAPLSLVADITNDLDQGLAFYNNLLGSGQTVTPIPDPILQSLRQIGDAMDVLGMHPENFETPAQAQLRAIKASQQLNQANTAAALAAAAASTPPTSFAAVNSLGTALLPGDAYRAAAQTTVGVAVNQYTGAQIMPVAQGDTLVNLAARYLGDARLWQDLAAANGLKPPFINLQTSVNPAAQTDDPLSGAVAIGATVLIPNYSAPPQAQPLLPVLGVTPDQSAAVHLLGQDLLLAAAGTNQPSLVGNSRNLLDFVIDPDSGATDLKTVAGLDNLAQALIIRTVTERGSDTLYQDVGIQPIIALNIAPIDLQTATFRAQETLLADPRVATVTSLSLTQSPTNPDQVLIDAKVGIRGFVQPTNIQITV